MEGIGLDLQRIRDEHVKRAGGLAREASLVYSALVLPNWRGELHGFPETLYGLMMVVFARFDILSSYWTGEITKYQTERMIQFLDQFRRHDTEANTVAVWLWRHKLMHTSRPRLFTNRQTGDIYCWLLHWHDHLPREQHFTLENTGTFKKLNLALMYLIEDLAAATEGYLNELEQSPELKVKYQRVDKLLNSMKIAIPQPPTR